MAMLVFCYTPAQRTINQTKHFPDPNRKHLIQMLNSTYPLKRDKEAEDTNRVWITRECLKKHTAEDVQYRRLHSSDLSLAGNNCDHSQSRCPAGIQPADLCGQCLTSPVRAQRVPGWPRSRPPPPAPPLAWGCAALRRPRHEQQPLAEVAHPGDTAAGAGGLAAAWVAPLCGTPALLSSVFRRVRRFRGVLARGRGWN